MKKISKETLEVRMTKAELVEVKGAITALLDSLSHYIDCNNSGYEAYWGNWEEYEKFIQKIADACNIIEKEIAHEKD